MRKIDAHQHFWKYTPDEYPWMQPDWPIRRDFLPPDLEPLLKANGFEACIAVQARQTLEESRWLLGLAQEHPFIAGVVGWVDLRSPRVGEQLTEFAENPKFVGVRHVVQDEPDDEFMLKAEFQCGIARLESFNLAYDLLIYPRQLPAATRLAARFPNQRFVLDHIAKPPIKEGKLEPWATHIRELARQPNVWCKLSGMVTEATWRKWRSEEFRPYLDVVWEAFGEDRLMAGSDWPVSLLSSDYDETMGIALDFLEEFQPPTRMKLLGSNAAKAYQLKS